MLERPAIDDHALMAAIEAAHGLSIATLEFVPLGNDSAAWTYRVTDHGGARWFVKVRLEVRPAGVLVPLFLRDHGVPEAVAVRQTATGDSWLTLGPWHVLVYPWLDAPSAESIGLDEGGWRRLGSVARRLHAAALPAELTALVRREAFESPAVDMAHTVERRIASFPDRDAPTDEATTRVAELWRANATVINGLIAQCDQLGRQLREIAPTGRWPFVLCHADLHVANVLVHPTGALALIDWDELILAPAERDLMFVRGSPIFGLVGDGEATAFEDGYGTDAADPLLIAWYRIDWALHDVADFARRAVLDTSAGPATRARAVELFERQFGSGGQVEAALIAEERSRRSEGRVRT
jgi:spectinomycin phosphotransferase